MRAQSLSFGALLAALAVPASAQTTYQAETYHFLGLGGIPSSGQFKRIVVGNFLGEGPFDVATIKGSALFVYRSPETYRQTFPGASSGAVDLAVVPGGGPAGQDAVAYITSSGLQLGSWDVSSSAHVFTSAQISAAWAGAAVVVPYDYNNDGAVDLVGIDASRTKLLRLRKTPSGWTSDADITVGTGVAAVAPLDWNGDGTTDFGVVAGTTASVCSASGSVLATWTGAAAPGGLPQILVRVRSRESGNPVQRLAWITGDGAGGQMLRALKPSSEDDVYLGGSSVCGACAGADNSDGVDDLVAGTTDALGVGATLQFRNGSASSSTSFSAAGTVLVLHAGRSDASLSFTPAFADLDGDGDLEGIVAATCNEDSATAPSSPLSTHLMMIRNSRIAENAIRPTVPVSESGGTTIYYYLVPPQPADQLQYRFTANVTQSIPSDATHIEVGTTFAIDEPNATLQTLDVGGTPHRELLPAGFASLAPGAQISLIAANANQPSHYNLSDDTVFGIFYFRVRFVRMETVAGLGTVVTKYYPSRLIAHCRWPSTQNELSSTAGQQVSNYGVDLPATAPIGAGNVSDYHQEISNGGIGSGAVSGTGPVPHAPRP